MLLHRCLTWITKQATNRHIWDTGRKEGRFFDFFYVCLGIGCDCEWGKQQPPRQKPETDYKVFLIFRRRTRKEREKITSTTADVQM